MNDIPSSFREAGLFFRIDMLDSPPSASPQLVQKPILSPDSSASGGYSPWPATTSTGSVNWSTFCCAIEVYTSVAMAVPKAFPT